ncbi:MAG TPA: prolipoprotein diacylglyceryl transferase [Verrucomicrobiae bacterium]|nr:prolipoprotein diacylglyceryl transferase [Verrucomicrobiae bacterium]
MIGPFIHRIDPVIAQPAGLCLWWYGLSYATGFLSLHLWLRRGRERLGLSLAEVDQLTLFLVTGVLLGGRLVEVFFYEWPFYSRHLALIPALWIGGMATHGLLLGAIVGAWLFCRLHRKSFLNLLDELAVPGALIMGLGRIGNFIDGQIVGSTTHVWWAVKFPDAVGYRHPVVLYDGLKNLMLVTALLWIRRCDRRRGALTGHFIFWYGFLRIFVDLFREYPTTLLGIATGQCLNFAMTVAGLGLLAWSRRNANATFISPAPSASPPGKWLPKLAFAGLLAFCLTIPSDWTQDIPARYGKRHPGLVYSKFYRPIGGAQ